ncbi:unannotated protein [freshwater metagenome]|uniref:Unannotated protein n=1 Tax=freshwater metagenome TaxID=449393 RepID=A0A6J7JM50_9ZZZZ
MGRHEQVVESVVAVDEGARFVDGPVRVEPVHDRLEVAQAGGCRRASQLPLPPIDLARQVAAVAFDDADGGDVDRVDVGERVDRMMGEPPSIEPVERGGEQTDARPLLGQYERHAEDRKVVTRREHGGDRDGRRAKRAQHGRFAQHVVRGRQQQPSSRWVTEHRLKAPESHQPGDVARPAGQLLHQFDAGSQPCGEAYEIGRIEVVLHVWPLSHTRRSEGIIPWRVSPKSVDDGSRRPIS